MRVSSLRTLGLLVGCMFVASGVLTGCPEPQSPPSGGTGETAPDEALLGAAGRGDVTRVTALLKGGAKVTVRDAAGRTPLHLAAKGAHADVLKSLILHDADVNATDDAGATPLDLARDGGHQQVVDLLLRHGAKSSIRALSAPAPVPTTQPPAPDPEVARVRAILRTFIEASLDGEAKAAGECCLAPMARIVTKAVAAGPGSRDAVTYTIRSVEVEGASAKAVVRTRNSNIPEPFSEFLVTYALKRTDEGWRIAEVTDMTPHLEPLAFEEDEK